MDRQIKAKDLEGNRSFTDVKKITLMNYPKKNSGKNLEIDEIE